MKKLTFKLGANSTQTDIPNTSDSVYAIVTDALETAETVTVPAGAQVAYFTADGDFWADFQGGTAAKPTVDITDGSASELNPTVVYLDNVSSFSVVSDSTNARTISIKFYS